jgi:hypothetical protein
MFGGFFICAYGFVAFIINVYKILFSLSFVIDYGRVAFLLGSIGFWLTIFLPIMIVGIAISDLFPLIHVSEKGIHYRSPFTIIPRTIGWRDVEGLVDLNWPKRWIVVLVSRKNFSLVDVKGLRMNLIYGLLIRYPRPVIFLHPSLDNHDEIVSRIRNHVGMHS